MTTIEAIARRLAEALADAAYTRKPEDKKRVAELQHELVTAVQKEHETLLMEGKTSNAHLAPGNI